MEEKRKLVGSASTNGARSYFGLVLATTTALPTTAAATTTVVPIIYDCHST